MSLSCSRSRIAFAIAFGSCLAVPAVKSGEAPSFVTYTHQMEEPGNLELSTKSAIGMAGGRQFLGVATEFEYGVKAWWTSEFYLDGQTTSGDSTVFTGIRFENRFRLLPREHWINPVLYVEFEDINGADKTLLEVVDHDGKDDLSAPNDVARQERKRELETKLILSSYVKSWTIAENFIVEKNVTHAPWEFGYVFLVSRPIGLRAKPDRCVACAENWQVGVEVYGGLGTHQSFGLASTSHYVAPTVSWQIPNGPTFSFSPGFGLTSQSLPVLFRVGVSYEIQQLGRAVKELFNAQNGSTGNAH